MNLIMLLMKCERFFRNDYSHALAQLGAVEGKGGGRKEEWRTVTNNEDLVAATQDSVG